jgi:curli biogenesis system outer membrane secretion channel CsgG
VNRATRFTAFRFVSCGLTAGVLAFGAVGCAKTGESAGADQLTANVGNYPPPSSSAPTPRAAVPPFLEVQAPGNFSGDKQQLARVAADQLTTLFDQTRRFEMVERAQLQQLLAEQNMEGIVRPDQMAKAGQVLGAQYLIIGR